MTFLKKGDTVVAAYAEAADESPSYTRKTIWVIIEDREGSLRREAMPESQHTIDMDHLFRYSAGAHDAMTRAVKAKLATSRRATPKVRGSNRL